MTDRGKEAALLRQRTGVGYHRECIHLQMIIIMETKRFMLNNTAVQLKTGNSQTVSTSGVAGIEDGHVVFFRQRVVRAALQVRVINPGNAGVRLEEFRHRQRVGAVALHAERQRFQAEV